MANPLQTALRHRDNASGACTPHVADAGERRPPSPRSRLRIAWLSSHAAKKVSCARSDASNTSYYCGLFFGLRALPDAEVRQALDLGSEKDARTREWADVGLLPMDCTMSTTNFDYCWRNVGVCGDPARSWRRHRCRDPPIAILLNKMFKSPIAKLNLVRNWSARARTVALFTVLPPAHSARQASIAGVPAFSLPYAVDANFGRHAPDPQGRGTRPEAIPTWRYAHDLGFSGGYARNDAKHYALRRDTIGNRSMQARLVESGVRLFLPKPGHFLPVSEYVSEIARTKLWLSTTEHPASGPQPEGDTVTTRYYEVLMSGRSLLLCDRSPQSYSSLGIREGVHAAMFNSSEEFYRQVVHYSRAENEPERLAMVAAARQLALEKHSWTVRATQLVQNLESALAQSPHGRSEARHRASTDADCPDSLGVSG